MKRSRKTIMQFARSHRWQRFVHCKNSNGRECVYAREILDCKLMDIGRVLWCPMPIMVSWSVNTGSKVACLFSPPVGSFLFSPSGFIEQGLLTVFAIQSSKNTDNALDLSDCFDHKRTWINTYENPFVNHLNHWIIRSVVWFPGSGGLNKNWAKIRDLIRK